MLFGMIVARSAAGCSSYIYPFALLERHLHGNAVVGGKSIQFGASRPLRELGEFGILLGGDIFMLVEVREENRETMITLHLHTGRMTTMRAIARADGLGSFVMLTGHHLRATESCKDSQRNNAEFKKSLHNSNVLED